MVREEDEEHHTVDYSFNSENSLLHSTANSSSNTPMIGAAANSTSPQTIRSPTFTTPVPQRRNFSFDSGSNVQDASSDNDSFSSALPTQDSSIDGKLTSPSSSRKPSLRFKIPSSGSSTPPTTSSSTGTPKPSAKKNFDLAYSDTIPENDVYNYVKPNSPFVSSFDTVKDSDGEDEFYHMDSSQDDLGRKETMMKRHRWGTTRNKKGVPNKERVNRSKTLKGILRHQSTIKRSRNNSVVRHGSKGGSGADNNDTDDDSDSKNSTTEEEKGQKRTIVFNKPLPDHLLDPETLKPIVDYPRNKIRTTKYTPLSFVPKNISNQFIHNIANVYFLTLIILGAFEIFGVPSPVLSAVPLIVIVIITSIKDAIEDSRRTVSDMEINNQLTHILTQNTTPSTDYVYTNYNMNEEKISPWRRFKKMNTRLLFRFIRSSKKNLTKEGRAQKAREKYKQESRVSHEVGRDSFDSQFDASTLNNGENPFQDQSLSVFPPGRKSLSHERDLRFEKKYWKEVKVGDILRIHSGEEIPADVIILASSDEDSCCYVETKNLDGETNLKVKQSLKFTSLDGRIRRADDLKNYVFEIDSEAPQANLYSYQGNAKYMSGSTLKQEAITVNNLLMRGCTLRNTKWVIGVVAYTGSDSKIMLNAGITPTKQSRMSRELNYYVFMNFVLLFVICFISGLVNGIYYRENNVSRIYFEYGTVAGSPFRNGLVSFFVALILYSSLVPISLYITIEIIKTAQAYFIYADTAMYYERLDYPCTPKSWSISDDLGQIEYVFSDKTGTLTQNVMEFKKCTVNGVKYGLAYTEALAGLRKRLGVDVSTESVIEKKKIAEDLELMTNLLKENFKTEGQYEDELTFVSSQYVRDMMGTNEKQKTSNEHFMLALALCHSVLIEPDPKDPSKQLLKAQSPDEAALVGTARSMGFVFKASTKKGILLEVHGKTKEYQILNILEFNSTRKRMSAIIKLPPANPNEQPKALLICKGADSIIYERLSRYNNDKNVLDVTSKHLDEFATEGLRTLCIAEREISWSQYEAWNKKHQIAASSLENREGNMEEVADSIERELVLLGGTAIEDRLQDGVPDTIALLGQAGIKLWVLTGDKVETAINIGFSCNLLGNDMKLLVLKTEMTAEELADISIPSETETEEQMIDELVKYYLDRYFDMEGSEEEIEFAKKDRSLPGPGFGVVIDGDALKVILANDEIKRKFLLLCKKCKAVLCCRVSPAQKAGVVKLVKETLDVMTLAIGDGSNDVAMIQAADVGIGIAGEEGRQAVMSSDYGIGQFRFLARLLLTHGRWSYKRFSEMIPSFFFKNVIFSIALFWYSVYNNFDGSYLFEYTFLMFYNLAFTSLPVIFLGIFDQDVSATVSLLVPELYRTGIERTEFTERKFWIYMIDAIYQSVISYFFPFLMYVVAYPNSNGLPLDHRYLMGIVVTCISCIACNLYILLHQYRWDWLSTLIICISILLVYFWTGLWTVSTYSQEFYKAAPQVFGCTSFWACTFIGVLVCLIPRLFYDSLQKLYWPHDVDIIRECVGRGDFAAYPDSYDPTDPKRPKISQYGNQIMREVSSAGHARPVSNTYNKSLSTDSTSELEMQQNANIAAYTPTPRESQPHQSQSQAPPLTGGLKVPQDPAQPQQRKSILSLFARNSKGASSFYDNNSLIDTYNFANTNDDLPGLIKTEEIAMQDFQENHKRASRISSEHHNSMKSPDLGPYR